MDLTTRTDSPVVEDQSWLGSEHGCDTADPITLDGALCGATFTTGLVKSGTAIAKVTATGRYGPYDDTAVDGRAVMAGVLYTTQQLNRPLLGDASTTYHNVGAALLWHCEVITANLPVTSGPGSVDAAGKADCPLIRFA